MDLRDHLVSDNRLRVYERLSSSSLRTEAKIKSKQTNKTHSNKQNKVWSLLTQKSESVSFKKNTNT